MPNVSYETKVRSVDLTIQINDISEETANRIREFIAEEMGRADPFADILVAERDATKTEPLPEIKEDPETTEQNAFSWNTLTRQQKRIRGMEAYRPVKNILAEAALNSKDYEWRYATAREFCEKYGYADARSFGTVLSGIADEGFILKQDKDEQHRNRTYYLPFPTTAIEEPEKHPVEETPKLDTIADRIREYHTGSGLTNADLSDLIGYPESVIKAWEAGTSVPSVEGKRSLETLFGKHIFDGVQKPVIW